MSNFKIQGVPRPPILTPTLVLHFPLYLRMTHLRLIFYFHVLYL